MFKKLIIGGLILLLTACGGGSLTRDQASGTRQASSEKSHEVVLFSLSLLDTGYRFGGKNPSAGLDCSGMVSYIYKAAAQLNVSGSAAMIAKQGRPIARHELRPGDLVFFNTRNASFSHVGVYLGDERFIHAPSSNGKVRIDVLNKGYFGARFEAARSYFD